MPAQSSVFSQQVAGVRDSTGVVLSPPKPLEIPRAARNTRYFAELIASVFPPAVGVGPRVIAFTSATRGAGVSFISTSVAREVAETCEGKVLLVQAEALECLTSASPDLIRDSIHSSRLGRLWTVNYEDRSYAEARTQYSTPERSFASVLDIVKGEFQSVILDVPSLASSDCVLRYASMVDSVVMVVEAGKTSKHALSVACRRIAVANGTVSGIICNKRKYPVPHWLYRYL